MRADNDNMNEDAIDEGAGADALHGAPEPWEPWETKLVAGCIGIGLVGLVVLGWLVDRFILA